MSKLKILLIDDHVMVREGLRLLLINEGLDCNLLEAASCTSALKLLEEHEDVDWILLDLGLPDMSGIEALGLLRKHYAHVPIVVVSGLEDRALVLECINRGAMGFIPKSFSSAMLTQALRVVFAGGVYLPPALFGQHTSTVPATALSIKSAAQKKLFSLGMTGRQIQVLELTVQGFSNKLIAKKLDLSEATIKTHVAASLRALNVKNRTQAVFTVAKFGLLADTDPPSA